MKEIEDPDLENEKHTLRRWEDALTEEYLHDQEIEENNNKEYKSMTLISKTLDRILKRIC